MGFDLADAGKAAGFASLKPRKAGKRAVGTCLLGPLFHNITADRHHACLTGMLNLAPGVLVISSSPMAR